MILKQIWDYVAPWNTVADGSQLLYETFIGIV